MRKLLWIAASAMALAACAFPETKMEPVGETQMRTNQQPAPTTTDESHTKKKASSG